MIGEVALLVVLLLVVLHWALYAVDFVVNRGRKRVRSSLPTDSFFRHPILSAADDGVTIQRGSKSTQIMASSIRGIWKGWTAAADFVDPMFSGVALFDEKGRTAIIRGWYMRTEMEENGTQTAHAERADVLFEDLTRMPSYLGARRVYGYGSYRLVNIVSTVVLFFIVLPHGFALCTVGGIVNRLMGGGLLIVPALWAALLKALWCLLLRVQLRSGRPIHL